MKNMIAETSITIAAPASAVWKAITTPSMIRLYLFGTTVKTDWKVGSPISYEGEYEGHVYHDKGQILEIVPEKIFKSTYWSSMGGKEDKPENYNTVMYTLEAIGHETKVTITQDNILSEKEKEHMIDNWSSVLKGLKDLVEKMVDNL